MSCAVGPLWPGVVLSCGRGESPTEPRACETVCSVPCIRPEAPALLAVYHPIAGVGARICLRQSVGLRHPNHQTRTRATEQHGPYYMCATPQPSAAASACHQHTSSRLAGWQQTSPSHKTSTISSCEQATCIVVSTFHKLSGLKLRLWPAPSA